MLKYITLLYIFLLNLKNNYFVKSRKCIRGYAPKSLSQQFFVQLPYPARDAQTSHKTKPNQFHLLSGWTLVMVYLFNSCLYLCLYNVFAHKVCCKDYVKVHGKNLYVCIMYILSIQHVFHSLCMYVKNIIHLYNIFI